MGISCYSIDQGHNLGFILWVVRVNIAFPVQGVQYDEPPLSCRYLHDILTLPWHLPLLSYSHGISWIYNQYLSYRFTEWSKTFIFSYFPHLFNWNHAPWVVIAPITSLWNICGLNFGVGFDWSNFNQGNFPLVVIVFLCSFKDLLIILPSQKWSFLIWVLFFCNSGIVLFPPVWGDMSFCFSSLCLYHHILLSCLCIFGCHFLVLGCI